MARRHLAVVLESLGVVVVTGAGTVEELSGEADVTILDGRLPNLSRAVAIVRGARPATALFVLAALDELDLVRAAVAAGANGAIRRPPLGSRVREAFEAAGIETARPSRARITGASGSPRRS